jgi:ABC-type lipoprotein release transport system permease subunit
MLIVRTRGDPPDLAPTLRREIHALDQNHVVSEVKTMRERLLDRAARSRFASRALPTFAFIALTLAALGIYRIVSLAVMQRRREFSVRLALGAGKSRVLTMVLREALGLVVVGGALGIAGAYVATRAMTSRCTV